MTQPDMTLLVFSTGSVPRYTLIVIHREADTGGKAEAEALASDHVYCGFVAVTAAAGTRTECEPGCCGMMARAVPTLAGIVAGHLTQQAKEGGN